MANLSIEQAMQIIVQAGCRPFIGQEIELAGCLWLKIHNPEAKQGTIGNRACRTDRAQWMVNSLNRRLHGLAPPSCAAGSFWNHCSVCTLWWNWLMWQTNNKPCHHFHVIVIASYQMIQRLSLQSPASHPDSLPSLEHVEMKPRLLQSLCPTPVKASRAAIWGEKTHAMPDGKEITD